jgi:hypothetical protein
MAAGGVGLGVADFKGIKEEAQANVDVPAAVAGGL